MSIPREIPLATSFTLIGAGRIPTLNEELATIQAGEHRFTVSATLNGLGIFIMTDLTHPDGGFTHATYVLDLSPLVKAAAGIIAEGAWRPPTALPAT